MSIIRHYTPMPQDAETTVAAMLGMNPEGLGYILIGFPEKIDRTDPGTAPSLLANTASEKQIISLLAYVLHIMTKDDFVEAQK